MKRADDDTNDPGGIEELLRQIGPRDEPPMSAMEDIRRAVHDEWLASVRLRRRRSRTIAYGIAASVALVTVVATWALRTTAPAPDFAVTIARVEGDARLQASSGAPGRVAQAGDPVTVGAVITTGDAGRISLAYAEGISVRIDRGGTLTLVSPDRLHLAAGTLYVDADPAAMDRALVIETRAGDVRHIGTQYLIRQSDETVEVGIREGQAQIERADGAVRISAGERVWVAADGRLAHGTISAQDPAWDWAEAMAPSFDIDGQSLAAFLEWVARETGRQVTYASPEARSAAETGQLHGSIEGLDPQTALTVVLSTTDFSEYEAAPDRIGIRLGKD